VESSIDWAVWIELPQFHLPLSWPSKQKNTDNMFEHKDIIRNLFLIKYANYIQLKYNKKINVEITPFQKNLNMKLKVKKNLHLISISNLFLLTDKFIKI
jgi:hypothetical protein